MSLREEKRELHTVSWYFSWMFCCSSLQHLYGIDNYTTFTKDAFHRFIIHGEKDAVNPKKKGTKVAPHYLLVVPSGEERVLQCRLVAEGDVVTEPFAERNFGAVIQKRLKEANEFYHVAIPCKLKHFIFNLKGIFFSTVFPLTSLLKPGCHRLNFLVKETYLHVSPKPFSNLL